MEQHRTPARAIRFYRVLGSLSSCDHLDLKNLLVLERRMAWPQGAGILADRTACKALDPNCNKVRPSISPYGASTCVWCWTSNLSPTTHLIPFPFLHFLSSHSGRGHYQQATRRKPHNDLVTACWRLFCIHAAFSSFLAGLLGIHSALPVKTEPLPQDHSACCTLT